MAWLSGDGAVWVTNRLANTLTRVNLATRQAGTVLPVGEQPGAVVVESGSVWVASSIDRSLFGVSTQQP